VQRVRNAVVELRRNSAPPVTSRAGLSISGTGSPQSATLTQSPRKPENLKPKWQK